MTITEEIILIQDDNASQYNFILAMFIIFTFLFCVSCVACVCRWAWKKSFRREAVYYDTPI